LLDQLVDDPSHSSRRMMPASTLDQIVSENQRANWYLESRSRSQQWDADEHSDAACGVRKKWGKSFVVPPREQSGQTKRS
jgi:hypothetical protein